MAQRNSTNEHAKRQDVVNTLVSCGIPRTKHSYTLPGLGYPGIREWVKNDQNTGAVFLVRSTADYTTARDVAYTCAKELLLSGVDVAVVDLLELSQGSDRLDTLMPGHFVLVMDFYESGAPPLPEHGMGAIRFRVRRFMDTGIRIGLVICARQLDAISAWWPEALVGQISGTSTVFPIGGSNE